MSTADFIFVIFLISIAILGGIGFIVCILKVIIDAINGSHEWEERG